MNLVIDASMALAWIFERANPAEAECADRVLKTVAHVNAIVPPLWHIEVANALLVGERRKIVTEAQVIDYLARLDHLPITVNDEAPAARRDHVTALAREHGLSAYDAIYLDLALRFGAALATFDTRLADAMRRAGGAVFD